MSDGYAKLFSDIVDSSIWDEDAETCKVWVTLLALSNAEGYVRGSARWLAHKSRVSEDKCVHALSTLTQPDKNSRTPDNEGRRIKEVGRGWLILNYLYFRNEHKQLSTDPRKVYKREWMKKKRLSTACPQKSTDIHTASASASVSGSGIEESEKEGVIGNLPTDEQAAKWLSGVRAAGADYTWEEVKFALSGLRTNGGMWGKNPIVDWRAALERQIGTDRQRIAPRAEPERKFNAI